MTSGEGLEITQAVLKLHELLKQDGDDRRMNMLVGWFPECFCRSSCPKSFGDLIEAARAYLAALHKATGEPVCTTDAVRYLSKHAAWADRVEEARILNNGRWAGQVFKGWCRWRKVGMSRRGSHGRPSQMWVRAELET